MALATTPVLSGCIDFKNARGSEVPMGSWPDWQDLTPLLEVAEAQVDPATWTALEQAQTLLREGKAHSADQALAKVANGASRHWVAVARADLAALHFTTCIRGVAWRLPDEPGPHARSVDYDPATRIGPADLSVEALLTNLDAAIDGATKDSALLTQARIARVRVTGFAASCPANDEVERRASALMNSDLATLAAEHHLTPDLAYMWAGVQYQTYSGTAARPFLLQASEGGFDDPSVTYMLALIALEQREYDEADRLASEAGERYAEFGDPHQRGQCAMLRGEVALESGRYADARTHFSHALELAPGQVAAIVGMAEVERRDRGSIAAAEFLHGHVLALTGDEELSEPAAAKLVDSLEALVIVANSGELELAQITRDALLLNIEEEPDPFRRAMRNFYAAALEVRLGDYEAARGHAAVAQLELEDSPLPVPIKANPREFLDRLTESGS
jgi:tetratricopeptide (TPR) repeat protein